MDLILHPLLALLASVTRQDLSRLVPTSNEEDRILADDLVVTVLLHIHGQLGQCELYPDGSG